MQLESEQRSRLDRDGYLFFPNLFQPDEIAVLIDEVPRLYAERRQENDYKTLGQIELAYRLGIPTIRVNTGRWGTSKNFDELMANRGIEPRLAGYSDDDAFAVGLTCGGTIHLYLEELNW